jgi:hypothetical protein
MHNQLKRLRIIETPRTGTADADPVHLTRQAQTLNSLFPLMQDAQKARKEGLTEKKKTVGEDLVSIHMYIRRNTCRERRRL